MFVMASITIYYAWMSRKLDPDLVRTFVAVADHASMTAAANARHLTQSAVSQQIRKLEDGLGQALIVRNRRNLRLTPTGEQLLGKARRFLALNDEIWAQMTGGRVEGRVRLGIPLDLAGGLISVLKAYAEAHPRVELSLTCATSLSLEAALAAGEIDLAVVEAPHGRQGGECLRTERLVWVGARGGTAHLKLPLPVSLVMDTCAFRPVVIAALQDQGRPWRTVFENGSLEATAASVRADLAVTAFLASTVPADMDVLGAHDGLPDLPVFAVSLHVTKNPARPAALLAGMLREGMTRPAPGPTSGP